MGGAAPPAREPFDFDDACSRGSDPSVACEARGSRTSLTDSPLEVGGDTKRSCTDPIRGALMKLLLAASAAALVTLGFANAARLPRLPS